MIATLQQTFHDIKETGIFLLGSVSLFHRSEFQVYELHGMKLGAMS